MTSTALGNIFSDFLIDRDVSGVRPATLVYYQNELKIFIQWIGEAGAQTLDDITPDLLRAYFLSLRDRRHQNGIHKNFTVVRTWLLWAWVEYDQPGTCPISKVKVASPKTKQLPAISLDNFSRLLSSCTGRDAKRDKAILLFLLDTGIRRLELCRLKISALQINGVVQLEPDETKTGESRKAFLTRATRRALKAYLIERDNLQLDSPLFATERGDPFTASAMREVIRRRCRRAGIPYQGMHAFRRGFALESLRAGADLVSISRLLGHKKVETTKRYLPQTEEDLHLVHERTSPVNKLRRGRR